MDFFQQLAATGKVDLTLRIMKVNEKLTIGVEPGTKSTGIKPMNFTGTPEDLDAEFFSRIIPGIAEVKGLVDNLEEVKKQVQDKVSKKVDAQKEPKEEKSKPVKSKSDKKAKPEKAVKKAVPVKKKEKISKAPAVTEASLFAADPVTVPEEVVTESTEDGEEIDTVDGAETE